MIIYPTPLDFRFVILIDNSTQLLFDSQFNDLQFTWTPALDQEWDMFPPNA